MMLTVFLTVLTMILYAVPGYVLVRTGKVRGESISAFAGLLMYVLQPFLMVYSFQTAECSAVLLREILWCMAAALLLMGGLLAAFYLILRKKREDVRYRVANVAVCFGNVGFMGNPIMTAVLPDCPQVYIYSASFFFVMSLLGWTVALALITRDKKHCALRRVLLNPSSIGMYAALLLFFAGIRLPQPFYGMVEMLGKMTTPLCMIIMGLRLATADLRRLVSTGMYYWVLAVKLIGMPLLAFAVLQALPLETYVKSALLLMCCCPAASVVQNFAELVGQGQKDAANIVLLSSAFSVLTIPLMSGLLQFL